MARDDLPDIPSFAANRDEAVASAPRGVCRVVGDRLAVLTRGRYGCFGSSDTHCCTGIARSSLCVGLAASTNLDALWPHRSLSSRTRIWRHYCQIPMRAWPNQPPHWVLNCAWLTRKLGVSSSADVNSIRALTKLEKAKHLKGRCHRHAVSQCHR